MKLLYKYCFLIVMSITGMSCYKYEKEISYATLKGSFTDQFTNTGLDAGNILLSPANAANGSMYLDTSGHFTNSKIIPGTYKVFASIKAAFTSDSADVTLVPGGTAEVTLKIEPWISILQSVAPVTDTAITVTYTIQGNKGLLPARHVIAWSTAPKPTASAYPGGSRNFYTPSSGNENGAFNYKITGLRWNTTYFIITGARIGDVVLNPANDYNYSRQIIVKTPAKP